MSPVSDVTAFRSGQWPRAAFLEAVRRAVTAVIEAGGVFDFLAHPSCLTVEDPRLETLTLICDLVQAAGDRARLASLNDIAATVS